MITNSICLECVSRGLCRMAGVEQEGITECRTFYKDAQFYPDSTPAEQLAKSQALVNQPIYPLNDGFDMMFGKKLGIISPIDTEEPLRHFTQKLEEWSN